MTQVFKVSQSLPFFVTKKQAQTTRRPGSTIPSSSINSNIPPTNYNQSSTPIIPTPQEINQIDTINAIHSGYCYLLIFIWIISSHILTLRSPIGQFYYFALLAYTTYFFIFKEPKTGLHKTEPSGHSVLRELIFGLQFFKDFCLLLFSLQCESISVFIVSYVSPDKFNKNEKPLNDTIRMFFQSFSSENYNISEYNIYSDIWLKYICKNYIPTTAFIFVLWTVLLCFANVQSPSIRCFKLLQKYCRCLAISRLLRILCFITTILPTSHYGCYMRRFSNYNNYDEIPQNLQNGKWWEEPLSWSQIFTWRTGGGCNDLIFSGHMIIIVATLMAFTEIMFVNLKIFNNVLIKVKIDKKNDLERYMSQLESGGYDSGENRIQKLKWHIKFVKVGMYITVGYLWWLSVLSGLKMITEKHHYTVDVVLAYMVTGMVYYCIGARNTATSGIESGVYYGSGVYESAPNQDNNGNKDGIIASGDIIVAKNDFSDNEPWWYIDILGFPRYNDWIINKNNVENYNFIAKRIKKLETQKSSNLWLKGYNIRYQWYLLSCMSCPVMLIFVCILPTT